MPSEHPTNEEILAAIRSLHEFEEKRVCDNCRWRKPEWVAWEGKKMFRLCDVCNS